MHFKNGTFGVLTMGSTLDLHPVTKYRNARIHCPRSAAQHVFVDTPLSQREGERKHLAVWPPLRLVFSGLDLDRNGKVLFAALFLTIHQ
jgi:hypothetical protein